ncbi:MAG: hypothetical protein P4M11_08425, partial [Candidatus Pacebacteria bacterium]|nr:hypothetical protein [Candidatus Paceibacterota bacterium]
MGATVTTFYCIATTTFARILSLYQNYPRISDPSDLIAYYRSNNRSLFASICFYMAGMAFTHIVRITSCFFEKARTCELLSTTATMFISFHIIHGAEAYYTYRLRQEANWPENRENLKAQLNIRSRLQIFRLLTFLGHCYSIESMLRNQLESTMLTWAIVFLNNIYSAMWFSDGLPVKLSQIFLTNLVFCVCAKVNGQITETLVSQILMPTIMSSAIVLAHDRETKHKFLLRRLVKEQKSLYESFLMRLCDPVIILDRLAGVIFANESAAYKVGAVSEEFYDYARTARSETGESLEACVKARLLYPEISRDAIKQERYRVRDEADPQREKIVVMTLIESSFFSR